MDDDGHSIIMLGGHGKGIRVSQAMERGSAVIMVRLAWMNRPANKAGSAH